MDDASQSELTPAHAELLEEARPGIERLVARMTGPADDVIFVVADVDSALGETILGLGVPRSPHRKSVVMPLTRADAIRAAGPLMSAAVAQKLEGHHGPAALVTVKGSVRLVALEKRSK